MGVRFMSQLQLMLCSIVNSMAMLFWCSVMLSFMWWALSLLFMQGFAAHLQDHGDVEPEEHDFINRNFGSLVSGMILFFQLGTGGAEWSALYVVLGKAGVFYQAVLLLYVAFFTFGVFNILTGMVVDTVMVRHKTDDEEKAMEFRQEKAQHVKALEHVFGVMDEDDSGTLTYAEFAKAMSTAKVRALLHEVGLVVSDIEVFFEMLLGLSDSHRVGIAAFVDGCMHVSGAAASIDVQILLVQSKFLHAQMQKSLCLSEAVQSVELSNQRMLKAIEDSQVSMRSMLARSVRIQETASKSWTPQRDMSPDFHSNDCEANAFTDNMSVLLQSL